MNRRILFVDDEPHLLRALERNLVDDFEVSTATSAAEAENVLAREDAFAVVVSDMRMPVMDGAAFLGRIRLSHPDATRILLTGYTDFASTVQAVNEGNIFRFLVKPCPQDQLERALEDAIKQHQLIVSERELLERTLMGAVDAMVEVLGLVAPTLFSRSTRIEQLVGSALGRLGYEPRWIYEIAAKLSQLGCVALPKEIVTRVNSGVAVSERERSLFEGHPETAQKILGGIPRLEVVADIIRHQLDREVPTFERREVSQGVALLRAAVMLDAVIQKGGTRKEAVEALLRRELFDEKLVLAFMPEPASATSQDDTPPGSSEVSVAQLKVGMILKANVLSTHGAVVVPAGREITPMVLERLNKFSLGVGIIEPIHIEATPSRKHGTAGPEGSS